MNLRSQSVIFCSANSCGENLYLSSTDKLAYLAHTKTRYRLEGSLIFPFARFHESRGQSVLEIGVGLGADHQQFAQFAPH